MNLVDLLSQIYAIGAVFSAVFAVVLPALIVAEESKIRAERNESKICFDDDSAFAWFTMILVGIVVWPISLSALVCGSYSDLLEHQCAKGHKQA